ncbi:uncharacterized protein SCHCODRAFT_02590185 [Schizophyllum commune H4-8]|uniref:uncharacterized protein n=1 Tax=Schizophyllum commune (strain H4-8 / FGSC 9210) TaxID=578458 RepID=UPI0021605FEA|nr:uncharacterized protein SCHCODRAFT_02590185 [Schizophyllum commune H4-8]KAI5886840.1 hypothetical protein SCHCODRAFT_02590185 [Schizophyllum commune H4-8]
MCATVLLGADCPTPDAAMSEIRARISDDELTGDLRATGSALRIPPSQDRVAADLHPAATAEDEARDTDGLRGARRPPMSKISTGIAMRSLPVRSARLDGDLRNARHLGASYVTLGALDEQVSARRSSVKGLPVVDVASPTLSTLDSALFPQRSPPSKALSPLESDFVLKATRSARAQHLAALATTRPHPARKATPRSPTRCDTRFDGGISAEKVVASRLARLVAVVHASTGSPMTFGIEICGDLVN